MADKHDHASIFTAAVHSGQMPPLDDAVPHHGSIIPSVGFAYPSLDETAAALTGGPRNFAYSRHGGPTQVAFEDAIAALEGADTALSFSSGMAALHAAILTVAHRSGHLVVAEAIYGMTYKLAQWLDANMDITLHALDLTNLEAASARIQELEPTALVCEVVSNPTLRVVDLPAIAAIAHKVGAQVVVDNTFASPYLLRPLELGADIVVHSATKFINGHGDVLAGVMAGPADLLKVAHDYRTMAGALLGPFEAWLALRGMRTLALRMRQACANAAQIADWLAEQPAIARVIYPGHDDHPDHSIAARLFDHDAFGAMLAFELREADTRKAFAFVEALRLVGPIPSLGDLSTIVLHPATASHRALTPEQRLERGIPDGLVRMSVGIEDAADIIADVEQALAAVR